MSRKLLVAVLADPTPPSGPVIQGAAVPWGLLPPYRLGMPATHVRVGVEYSDEGDRWWLDGASPRALITPEHGSNHKQATWEVTGVDAVGMYMAVKELRRLAGTPYDWAQIIEQGIPFAADHGGIKGHEICTSVVAMVLAKAGGACRELAKDFLASGCRHPERLARMFTAAEGKLLRAV